LICEIDVPVSRENKNPFPILSFLDKIMVKNPGIQVLVVSYINYSQIINLLIKKGISGYILKDDKRAIQNLNKIIEVISDGGLFFSREIQEDIVSSEIPRLLTDRQFEVLMMCAALPDEDTATMARDLNISNSTFRNILSQIYKKLNVRTRMAAILKARQEAYFLRHPVRMPIYLPEFDLLFTNDKCL
jgi:DNA-binding NarL/FixJ family response regulator